MKLLEIIPCENLLGEGIQWNHQDGCFWWTDIHSAKLYRYHLATKKLSNWDLPEKLGCFSFAKMIHVCLLHLLLALPGSNRNREQLSGLQNQKRIWLVIVPMMAVVIVKGVSGWGQFANKKIHRINVHRFILCK